MDETPLKRYGCIYVVTCLENNKKYVGQYAFENPIGRYTRHWAPHQKDTCVFHRALWKYGKESFHLERLGVFLRSSLNNMEAYYAEQFQTYIWDTFEEAFIPGGYNIMLCGQMNRQGMKHSPESIVKMTNASKGRKHSEETKQKMSESHIGKKHSLEHIEKHRNAILGYKHTDETRAKMSVAGKGKKKSDEARANMSAGRKGLKVSDETRQKLSIAQANAQKNKIITEEVITQRKNAVNKMLTKLKEMRENGTLKQPTQKQLEWRAKAPEIMRQKQKEKREKAAQDKLIADSLILIST